MKSTLRTALLLGLTLPFSAFTETAAIKVHDSGKIGINLDENSEPTAQVEINGDTQVNGVFNLKEQTELPATANQGDFVLLDDGTLNLYLGGEWRRVQLEVPDSNLDPVANAGADITTADYNNSNSATVTLDGTQSTDDIAISSYSWELDGEEIADTANPTVELPLGYHTITLTVKDNYGVEASDTVFVNVQFADINFDDINVFTTMDAVANPGTPTGAQGALVGEIDFLESTTAKKTKTYNSSTLDIPVGDMQEFAMKFTAGLSAPENGDLRIRFRVYFDVGSTQNGSFFQLNNTTDHQTMRVFSNNKTVPDGATKIVKFALQVRSNTFPFPAQTGFIENIVVEEIPGSNQL